MGEIKVSIPELAGCNGNLKALAGEWSAMPPVSDGIVSASSGASADCVKGLPSLTKEVASAFSDLLSNSVGFFSAAGVTFEDADNKSADSYLC